MADTIDLAEQLSDRFLKIIIRDLKEETIDLPTAKKLAQEFIALEPFTTVEDARPKIETYVANYPQFASIKTYIDAYLDEKKIANVVDKMKQHIKDDNIDEALKVAKESE